MVAVGRTEAAGGSAESALGAEGPGVERRGPECKWEWEF